MWKYINESLSWEPHADRAKNTVANINSFPNLLNYVGKVAAGKMRSINESFNYGISFVQFDDNENYQLSFPDMRVGVKDNFESLIPQDAELTKLGLWLFGRENITKVATILKTPLKYAITELHFETKDYEVRFDSPRESITGLVLKEARRCDFMNDLSQQIKIKRSPCWRRDYKLYDFISGDATLATVFSELFLKQQKNIRKIDEQFNPNLKIKYDLENGHEPLRKIGNPLQYTRKIIANGDANFAVKWNKYQDGTEVKFRVDNNGYFSGHTHEGVPCNAPHMGLTLSSSSLKAIELSLDDICKAEAS